MTNDPLNDPSADRRANLNQLFSNNYPEISEGIFERHPKMTIDHHAEIVDRLAALLPSYDGLLTDDGIQEWAKSRESTDRTCFLLCIHADCQPYVYSAIWRTIGHASEPSKFDDYPELVQELAGDAWIWAIEHRDELMVPGPAQLSTRLYEAARYIALAWKKKQTTRRRAMIRHLYDLPSNNVADKFRAELDAEAKCQIEQSVEVDAIRAIRPVIPASQPRR
ncbi:MAG TPA: hypothetical protein VHX37_11325 [Acidobacteriaceae bacterium]|nr:hypothetical protein [Acidobacteriaceae bacterium]